MTVRRLIPALVCASTLVVTPAPALAQSGERAAAEALFRAGREATAKGDHELACRRFEESNRLDPAVGTIFNIANCREKLGQLASAWQRYQEALQKLPSGDSRAAIASQRAAALEKRLPRLTLKLAEDVPGRVTILKDGVELGSGSLGVQLPVDPGEHVLILQVVGYEDNEQRVTVAEGEQREVELELGPPKADPSSALPETRESVGMLGSDALRPSEQERAGSSQRTLGFVIGGIGIAGLAVSGVTGALVLSKKSDVEDNCVDKRCTQAGLDAGDDGKTLSTVSTVAFVAGAVGLGTGLVLVLTSDKGGSPAATLNGGPVAGGGMLRLGGKF